MDACGGHVVTGASPVMFTNGITRLSTIPRDAKSKLA